MSWDILGFIIIGVCIFVLVYFKQKEGFDNPHTLSKSHQGDIETLRKQIMKFTTTEESLNVLQGEVKKISEQATKLQNNMPDGQVKKFSK
jgi:hypothetical protein